MEDDRDEIDPDNPGDPVPVLYSNMELQSITDERGGSYVFSHERNLSIGHYVKGNFKPSYSVPMYLNSVTSPLVGKVHVKVQMTLPDGSPAPEHPPTPRLAYTSPYSNGAAGVMVSISQPTDPGAKQPPIDDKPYVYRFTKPVMLEIVGLSTNSGVTQGYKMMTITAPDGGVETYDYDSPVNPPNESDGALPVLTNLLLSKVTDRNQKITTFGYNDGPTLNGSTTKLFAYDDPTSETDADGFTKTMAYDPETRQLMSSTIPRSVTANVTTSYTFDGGRRTSETVKSNVAAIGGGSKKTFVYDDSILPGFISKQTLDTPVARTSTDPSFTPVPVITTTRATGSKETDSTSWWCTISESVDMDGRKATTTTWHDFNGNKTMVLDPRGQATRFEYDGRHRLTKVIYPDGATKSLAYDAHGNLVQEIDEMGVMTFHEYDALNRRTKSTLDLNRNGQPDARYTKAAVATALHELQSSYNGDMVTETTYNRFNLPVTKTDSQGIVTLFEYDVIGRLIQTTVNATSTNSALKQITRYASTNPTKEDFDGASVFDVSGFKPRKVTDPRGNTTEYEYDNLYRPEMVKRPDGRVVRTTYNAAGQVTSVSDPADFTWNPLPKQQTTEVPDGSLVLPKVAGGVYITYTAYDALGQPQKITYPDGKTVQNYSTPSGQIWRIIDETNAETITHYNMAGLPVKVIQPKPVTTSPNPVILTSHDLSGNPSRITDPRGNVVRQIYDGRNRLVQTISPPVTNASAAPDADPLVSPVITTTYDASGRVVAVTDPMGYTSRKVYDAAGRVIATFDPLDQAALMTYDAAGHVLTVTNPLGQTVTNLYDSLGRLTSTTDHARIKNEFTYDASGNRLTVTDGKGQTSYFEYDALNRLNVERTYDGTNWQTTTHSYQTAATASAPANYVDKATMTDPAGRVISYTYDNRHRLTKVARTPTATGTPEAYALESAYVYDANGRLSSVTDKSIGASTTSAQGAAVTVSTVYVYDALGRVLKETSNTRTHQHEYDIAGNRIKSKLAVSGTAVPRSVVTEYDALNRPVRIVDDNATTAIASDDRVTSYGYDLAGRAVTQRSPNSMNMRNTYDGLGRLTSRLLGDVNSVYDPPPSGFTWTHDALGNVLTQTETWPASVSIPASSRTTVMTYDAANRLDTETVTDSGRAAVTTDYEYDKANNRIVKNVTLGSGTAPAGVETGCWSYSYNGGNQLVSWQKRATLGGSIVGAATYTYDACGNRTSKAEGLTTPLRTTTYRWNAWNKLIGVLLPDGKNYSYSYDYRSRRVSTAQLAAGGLAAKHTAVVFNGGLSVGEYERTSATALYDTTVPTVQYVRGADMGGGVGGLLYSQRGATAKYNLSNGRGDIVAQSDGTGALTWTASYEAYGKRTKETGTNADKQRANTKDEDPTGLLNEGFRYRDIETGVWLSRDPAGFVDGPNLYAYVRQNPWTAFDPHGLADQTQQKAEAIKKLAPLPETLRLPAAKIGIAAKIQERMGESRGIKGVRDWISTEAGFTKKTQYDLLDTYLNIGGKHKPSIEMSQREIFESGPSVSLQRSPEFMEALKNNSGDTASTWNFKGGVLAGADTTATLGTFTANVDAKVTSKMVGGKPVWKAQGTFTVSDTYDFNVDDGEASRAINDMISGVDKGPYQGRSQSGQLKTLLMSQVPGQPFNITSGPVSFGQVSSEPTARVITNAGAYQSKTEYK